VLASLCSREESLLAAVHFDRLVFRFSAFVPVRSGLSCYRFRFLLTELGSGADFRWPPIVLSARSIVCARSAPPEKRARILLDFSFCACASRSDPASCPGLRCRARFLRSCRCLCLLSRSGFSFAAWSFQLSSRTAPLVLVAATIFALRFSGSAQEGAPAWYRV
jgi:hypothetical protein